MPASPFKSITSGARAGGGEDERRLSGDGSDGGGANERQATCLSDSCSAGLRRETQRLLIFFNDTAATEIYTLSLHDALPIYEHTSELQSHDNLVCRLLEFRRVL